MSVKLASDEYLRLKAEVSRMAQIVNKRMIRLEQAEMQFVPVMQMFEKDGRPHFGVRGKSYNELQSEYWQLKRYMDAKTGTVRQARAYAQDVLNRIGAGDKIKGATVDQMNSYMKNLFDVTAKIQEYLKTTEQSALALDYQKIWNMVSAYFDGQGVDIANLFDNEQTAVQITNLMEMYKPVENNMEGYASGSIWDWTNV